MPAGERGMAALALRQQRRPGQRQLHIIDDAGSWVGFDIVDRSRVDRPAIEPVQRSRFSVGNVDRPVIEAKCFGLLPAAAAIDPGIACPRQRIVVRIREKGGDSGL